MTAPQEAPAANDRADGPDNDQAVRRTVAREYRSRRSVPAVIVALLLAAATLLVAVELISQLVGEPLDLLPTEELARLGRETQWNDPLAITVAIVAGLVGLLLLILALWPGRTRAAALRGTRPGVVVAVPTGDLQRIVVHAAEAVDGVDRANAQVAGGNKITVRADSPLHDTGDLGDQVQRAVDERLEQLGLARPPRVRVNVRHREE